MSAVQNHGGIYGAKRDDLLDQFFMASGYLRRELEDFPSKDDNVVEVPWQPYSELEVWKFALPQFYMAKLTNESLSDISKGDEDKELDLYIMLQCQILTPTILANGGGSEVPCIDIGPHSVYGRTFHEAAALLLSLRKRWFHPDRKPVEYWRGQSRGVMSMRLRLEQESEIVRYVAAAGYPVIRPPFDGFTEDVTQEQDSRRTGDRMGRDLHRWNFANDNPGKTHKELAAMYSATFNDDVSEEAFRKSCSRIRRK